MTSIKVLVGLGAEITCKTESISGEQGRNAFYWSVKAFVTTMYL